MERRMNKFAPPLTPLSFPIVLLVILLATVIFSSASASECFEHDSGSVDNKVTKNKNENENENENENKNKSESKRDIAQVIKCLTEELESFEKINQDLRVKVYELEQTVFEGFDSNFSEQPEQIIPTFKQAETNLPLAKISSKINKIAAGKISDSTEAIKVFKDSSQ